MTAAKARGTAAGALRIQAALRRRARLLRGMALRAHPGVHVAAGALVGPRVRLRIEPGGEVVLGAGCELDDGVTIAASRGALVQLGERAFVGHDATLAARRTVIIGSGTFLAELVSIRDHDHDPDRTPSSGAALVDPVSIGQDCWLASKVTVTRGVTIGDRVVVGAHAVVTRSLPPDVLAVGVPARVVEPGTGVT